MLRWCIKWVSKEGLLRETAEGVARRTGEGRKPCEDRIGVSESSDPSWVRDLGFHWLRAALPVSSRHTRLSECNPRWSCKDDSRYCHWKQSWDEAHRNGEWHWGDLGGPLAPATTAKQQMAHISLPWGPLLIFKNKGEDGSYYYFNNNMTTFTDFLTFQIIWPVGCKCFYPLWLRPTL